MINFNNNNSETTDLKLLQWNIQGLNSKSAILYQTIREYDIIALQEANTRCKYYVAPQIANYRSIQDQYGKTIIYVKDNIEYEEIRIEFEEKKNPKDKPYVTGIIIKQKNKEKIAILNTYRSCNGKAKSNKIVKNIMKELKEKKIYKGLILGDFNCSHELWGAKIKSKEFYNIRQIEGRELVTEIANLGLEILNNDKPTRFNRVNDKIIGYSWIDITLGYNINKQQTIWKVIEKDNKSDHYQIEITLKNGKNIDKEKNNYEKTWKLTDNEWDWEMYNVELKENWKKQTKTIIDDVIKDKRKDNNKKAEEIVNIIQKLYTNTASKLFKKKKRKNGWKKWINSKMQRISIEYHEMFREIRNRLQNKEKITEEEWNKYKELRRKRNKIMKQYKTEWIKKKFSKYGLKGKEGWQVAAEVRDLNKNTIKELPDIEDEKGNIIAENTKEKADCLIEWYHRFDEEKEIKTDTPIRRKIRNIKENRDEEEKREIENKEEVLEEPDDLEIINKNVQIIKNIKPKKYFDNEKRRKIKRANIWNRYKMLLNKWNYNRWKKCKKKHQTELNKLNSKITKAEVRRAIKSFNNNKAQGPDQVHIKFIKKTVEISTEILQKIYNILYKELQILPSNIKDRWIKPLCKPGKNPKIRKNLRPISLTSYLSKIFEKIICYRLVNYLILLGLISDTHFAYLGARSTIDAVIYLTDTIYRNMNMKRETHSVFFDFSSAFDCVRINKLLWKLKNECYIEGECMKFMSSFLTNRESKVKIGATISKSKKDVIGVPQGGALSPLLFLIYINGISVINNIKGINLSIFADDLCIFSRGDEIEHIEAIQEGIFFIQWYAKENGLFLNKEKTQYKIFKKKRKNENSHKYNNKLVFIENINVKNRKEKIKYKVLKNEKEPIKYLGIYMDTELNWKHHIRQIITKINKTHYIINRNLRDIWNIETSIVYNIIEACILSIIDYSAVLSVMWKKKDIDELEKYYKNMIKNIIRPVKGTPYRVLYQQFNVLSFRNRLKKKVSHYATHILRLPKSGILAKVINEDWWKVLNIIFELKNKNASKKRIKRTNKWLNDNIIEYAQYKNSIIHKIMNEFSETNCSDVRAIKAQLRYWKIEKEISFYIDLTEEIQNIKLERLNFNQIRYIINKNEYKEYKESEEVETEILEEEEEKEKYNKITDEWLKNNENKKDIMYIFTDGSVKDRIGGYGYHMITKNNYIKYLNKDYEEYKKDINKISYKNQEIWLSERSSIEYCEASAIKDSIDHIVQILIYIDTKLEDRPITELKMPETFRFDKIRIISDSETVLKMITGEYKIKDYQMKLIIDSLKWNISILKADYGIEVKMNWVKAHMGIKGNEYADELAKKGIEWTRQDIGTGYKYKQWKYYSKKAVKTEINQYYNDKEDVEWNKYKNNTKYGKWYKENGIRHMKEMKEEIKLLKRDETRLIIAIRSGHIRLNGYLYNTLKIGNSDKCTFCNNEEENLKHFMKCTNNQVREEINNMISKIMELRNKYLTQRTYEEENYETRSNLYEIIKENKINDYIMYYGGEYMDREQRINIMKYTINTVRRIFYLRSEIIRNRS